MLSLCATIGVSACTSIPDQSELQKISAVERSEIGQNEDQHSTANVISEIRLAIQEFWSADHYLSAYIEEGLRESITTRRTALAVERAALSAELTKSARRLQSENRYSSSASTNLTEFTRPNDFYSNALSFSLDTDLFGARRSLIYSREFDAVRATDAMMQSEAETIFAIVSAYYSAIEAREQAELAGRNVNFLKDTLSVVEQRFEAGSVAYSDLLLAQLAYDSTAAELGVRQLAERTASRNLMNLLGRKPGLGLNLDQRLTVPLSTIEHNIPAPELILRRADVSAAKANVIARFHAWRGTAKEDLPTLVLSSRTSDGSRRFEDVFDIDNYVANLAGALAATIMDGGFNKTATKLAELDFQDALEVYRESLRSAIYDLYEARDAQLTLTKSLRLLENATRQAQETLQIEEIRYESGVTSLLDVLNVQQRVVNSESSTLSVRRDLLITQAGLWLALPDLDSKTMTVSGSKEQL